MSFVLNRNRLPFLILLLASLLALFHAKMKPSPDSSQLGGVRRMMGGRSDWKGKISPDFEIALLGGEAFRLTDHIGKQVLILNFFATWCPPCRAEMPAFIQFYEAHRQEGLILLGIDAHEDLGVVRGFIQEMQITFSVGIDEQGQLGDAFGVDAYPTTVVIGVDGTVQLYETGRMDDPEVVLGPLLKSNQQLLEEGKGVSKERYLELLKQQPMPSEVAPTHATPGLKGRAAEIAKSMDCPCGCTHKVSPCNCKTAKAIKQKLGQMNLDGKLDQAIIMTLNKEFCVEGTDGDAAD